MITRSEVAGTGWQPPSRARWGEAEGRQVCSAFEASGQSVEEFARRHGIQEQRLRAWLKRLERRDGKQKQPTFVPVRLAGQARRPSPWASRVVEVISTSGRVVRVDQDFDSELLQRVLRAVEEEPC